MKKAERDCIQLLLLPCSYMMLGLASLSQDKHARIYGLFTQSLWTGSGHQGCPMEQALTFERERQPLPRIRVLLAAIQHKVRDKSSKLRKQCEFRVLS